MRYLAIDTNNDRDEFDTIEEAREWLEESFLSNEGYHPDLEDCRIYELIEVVKKTVVQVQGDMTDEQWSEISSTPECDEIWRHEFVKIEN